MRASRQSIVDKIRVQGQTAYFTYDAGSQVLLATRGVGWSVVLSTVRECIVCSSHRFSSLDVAIAQSADTLATFVALAPLARALADANSGQHDSGLVRAALVSCCTWHCLRTQHTRGVMRVGIASAQLIEKVANWVAAPSSPTNSWWYPSTQSLSLAAFGLVCTRARVRVVVDSFIVVVVLLLLLLTRDVRSRCAGGVRCEQGQQSAVAARARAAGHGD